MTASDSNPVRVLIVDDSALVRATLIRELAAYSDIEVVGSAPDPYVARDMIAKLSPHALILDMEMPRMDGLTFLKKIMRFAPMPVIVVSSLTKKGCKKAMECLEAGAIHVLGKPGESYSIGDLSRELAHALRGVPQVKLRRPTPPAPRVATPIASRVLSGSARKIVVIGTSTGGTDALKDVLSALPANSPGIAVVQHMPAVFTHSFAERLDGLCALNVKEAQDGDRLASGTVLIAPGDLQMKLVRNGAEYGVRIESGPRVCRHRPSAEVLFDSTAKCAGANAMGIIMTGMGDDGASALGSMRRAGAFTVAQDEKTCVVFGMPHAAIKAGSVDEVLPLGAIPQRILDYAGGKVPTNSEGRKAS